jgi:tRNA 2-selenouridine synthase
MPKFFLLTGLTGSGKTQMLHYLQGIGQQVLDLETIANHSGSIFGGINREETISQAEFEQILQQKFLHFSEHSPVYMEFKGNMLGNLKIPEWLLNLQQNAEKIFLDTNYELRIENILKDYEHISNQQFEEIIKKMKGRLSPQSWQEAEQAIIEINRRRYIEIMVKYFDESPAYKFLIENSDYQIVIKNKIDLGEIYSEILKLL